MTKPMNNIVFDESELGSSSERRHEALVEVFGHAIMDLRRYAMQSSRELAESQTARESIGNIQRRKYDNIAALDEDARKAAYAFTQGVLDRFIQSVLVLFTNTGVEHTLGGNLAIRFKLDLEVLETISAFVKHVETINRGGEKAFFDYWGRWLNAQGPK